MSATEVPRRRRQVHARRQEAQPLLQHLGRQIGPLVLREIGIGSILGAFGNNRLGDLLRNRLYSRAWETSDQHRAITLLPKLHHEEAATSRKRQLFE